MICFPDTNVVFKLAGFDLLTETLAVLNVAPQNVFVLAETRNMCRGPEMRTIYGRQAVARAEAFVQAAGRRAIIIDRSEHEVLTLTDGIEAGEAILFAATKGQDDFIILTDDKNSLRALAEENNCLPVFDRVRGKVVCLEQLLLWIIARYGYEQIQRKLIVSSHCIHAIRQTLGANQQSPQAQVESALRFAVERLRQDSNYILTSPEYR